MAVVITIPFFIAIITVFLVMDREDEGANGDLGFGMPGPST